MQNEFPEGFNFLIFGFYLIPVFLLKLVYYSVLSPFFRIGIKSKRFNLYYK